MRNELPDGWIAAKLGGVADDISYGYTASADVNANGPRFLRITDIQNGQVDWQEVPRCPTPDNPRFFLKDQDIVIARTGATTGKSFLIERLSEPAVFASYLIKVRAGGGILPKYLSRFMESTSYWGQIQQVSKGTAQPGANASILSDLDFPIAPALEQHRIVTKIDSLFARSSRARDELAHIPKLIDRYRQAVLEAAFRGDLTADWREANPTVSGEITIPTIDQRAKRGRRQEKQFTHDLSAIPTTWAWNTFGNCVMSYQNGLSKREGSCGTPESVLRLADIDGGRIMSDCPRQIILDAAEKADYELRPNDLIFIRVNGSASLVGRCLLFSENRYWAFCDHFIRARTDSRAVTPAFARLFFDTPATRGLIENSFVSSAGQKTISQGTLSALPIPLPPIAEQMLIVKRVEKMFARVRQSADEVGKATTRLDRLDQSILDKAFTGQLVPQDPADEPASVLLERIQAARAAAPKAKRGRKQG